MGLKYLVANFSDGSNSMEGRPKVQYLPALVSNVHMGHSCQFRSRCRERCVKHHILRHWMNDFKGMHVTHFATFGILVRIMKQMLKTVSEICRCLLGKEIEIEEVEQYA